MRNLMAQFVVLVHGTHTEPTIAFPVASRCCLDVASSLGSCSVLRGCASMLLACSSMLLVCSLCCLHVFRWCYFFLRFGYSSILLEFLAKSQNQKNGTTGNDIMGFHPCNTRCLAYNLPHYAAVCRMFPRFVAYLPQAQD